MWRMAPILCLAMPVLAAAQAAPITEEGKVPPYTLPHPLTALDGSTVRDAQTWKIKRRPEILAMCAREMYGQSPERPVAMTFTVREQDARALNGKATRKQVSVCFAGAGGPCMELLLYIPNAVPRPVPAFLGLNFWGNHAIAADTAIRLSRGWTDSSSNSWVDLSCVRNGQVTAACRGVNARQWPLDSIFAHGYAVATAYRGDIDPDFDDAFRNGVHSLYPGLQGRGDNFATIAAWAWGLQRALDCLAADPDIDARRVAVFGWSRLGKAALWAAATDERFAMAVSIQSGAGGAALSKRIFGEDVKRLNSFFPHWFCGNFKKYGDDEKSLPFDQHLVLAAIAPRPLYVSSAAADLHADPRGEFLSALAADTVYRLLGTDGLPAKAWPAANQPVSGQVGYHVRPGGHDVLPYDWSQYLRFADLRLKPVVPAAVGFAGGSAGPQPARKRKTGASGAGLRVFPPGGENPRGKAHPDYPAPAAYGADGRLHPGRPPTPPR